MAAAILGRTTLRLPRRFAPRNDKLSAALPILSLRGFEEAVAISWQLQAGKNFPEIATVASLLRNDNLSTAVPILSLRGFEEAVAISWQLQAGKNYPEIARR